MNPSIIRRACKIDGILDECAGVVERPERDAKHGEERADREKETKRLLVKQVRGSQAILHFLSRLFWEAATLCAVLHTPALTQIKYQKEFDGASSGIDGRYNKGLRGTGEE